MVNNEDVPSVGKPRTEWEHSENYVYNGDTDTYVTFLPIRKKPIVVPGDVHRGMLRAYSNWDGTPSSINEICRQFAFPKDWFSYYKTAHGWTHDLEPVTKEELLSRDEDELVQDLLQTKRQSLFQKFEQEDWKSKKKAADKWFKFDETFLKRVERIMKESLPKYSVPKLVLPKAEMPFAVVHSAMDLHYGKGGWIDEVGTSWTRDECANMLLQHTQALASMVTRFGRPEKIMMGVGSDWFHVDNLNGTTTAGTPQDMEGAPTQIFLEGAELAVEHIDMLRQLGPVELVMCAGNHDRQMSLMLLMYLNAWYKDASDVSVLMSPAARQYLVYGDNLVGFTHGDDIKVPELASIMATEAREDWGRTYNHMFFTGHMHHEITRDINGITHFQLPSLCGADKWHSKKGYVTSRRALTAYLLHKQEGVVATLASPVRSEFSFGFKNKYRAKVRK